MDGRRLRIDLFAFALGALALLTFGFYTARNGGAVIMCSLCLAGLLVARFAGFNNRALVPLAVGLIVLLWIAWIEPPELGPNRTSALLHGLGGVLVGWAMSEFLRGRIEWPLWAIAAVAAVLGLTILWELGEWLGDQVLTTGLIPSKRDSAIDIAFGTLGAAAGTLIAALIPPRTRSR
jgi:hypothetical protein